MSRVPGDLARRLDRLGRRAHAFHRFAHHPLCEAYGGEVLAFGRRRICKGCTFLVLGALAGLPLGSFPPVLSPLALALVATLSLAWAAAVFAGTWSRQLGKVGTRLVPALLASFLGLQGLRSRGTAGLVLVTGLSLALPVMIWAYRRRGPWRGLCEACPEKEARPCSGFRPQYLRERAFRRLAGRLLAASPPPDLPGL